MRTDVASTAPIHRAARIAIAFMVIAAACSAASAAESINVILDQARIAKVPDHTSTIVVGNPLIADVSIQAGGTMVVTGKGYGVTNLIALDRTGKVLAEQLVRVRSPSDSCRRLSRHRARILQLCAVLRAADHARRCSGLFRKHARRETGNRNTRAQQSKSGAAGAR